MTVLLPPYTTGTVTVAANGTVVTGSSVVWSDLNAREGDWLRNPATGYVTVITGRLDANHLTVPAWKGTAIAAGAYEIYPYSPLRYAGGTAMADVQALLAIINGATIFYQVAGSAPDNSLGEDGDIAIKVNASPWQQWVKSGGAWVSQGVPLGISNKGAWSSSQVYAVNDVVGSGGNAYLCIAQNQNAMPPNNTYWVLLGAKGDTGNPGVAGNAATVAIGSVTTGAAGSSAAVSNVGSSNAATLNFTIPRGDQGIQGIQGSQGIQGPTAVISGTSASVATVGLGTKVFVTQAGIAWPVGTRLRAVNAGGDRVLVGLVTAYSGTSLTLSVDTTQGVGADNTWTIHIAGEIGQQGGTGPSGPIGPVGPVGPVGLPGAASTVPGPKGDTGTGFTWSASGTLAQRAASDGQTTGYAFLQTDTAPFRLWVKASNTSADWAGPTYVGGQAAVGDMGLITDSVLDNYDYGSIAA
ncbi:hypothetical protein [uncultured Bradyrhizobium sp.]|uniref:hypothetical protein n=1 Tax=uncultured Bradyrhizobium sp. TaxID=199684 RepID=UPI0035CC7BCC